MIGLGDPADTREVVAVLRSVSDATVAEAIARSKSASAAWARPSPLARGEICAVPQTTWTPPPRTSPSA